MTDVSNNDISAKPEGADTSRGVDKESIALGQSSAQGSPAALESEEAKGEAAASEPGEGALSEGEVSGEQAPKKKHTITRRQVLAMAGCGVAGLIVGGVLASWGVTERSIASGRIDIRTTPTKMIVTDRARCSGCQRCEMMCTLKNDGRVCQHIARVRVRDNYFWGYGVDSGGGALGLGEDACRFTVEHCKQCADPACANYCPVHAISSDPQTGARVVDPNVCIGCGMCAQACPWNMPRIDTETGVSTKCISCGRCAEQCPNGAIKFIDWQDIAQKVIDQGVVRTTTLV